MVWSLIYMHGKLNMQWIGRQSKSGQHLQQLLWKSRILVAIDIEWETHKDL